MTKTEDELKELREDLNEVAERLERLKRAGEEDTKKMYEDLFEKSKDKYGEVREKVKSKGQEVDKFVEENPWKAVGAAALVGFIAGILISKNKR